jgi:hypothetical protein
VAYSEGIILTFGTLGKTGNALIYSVGMKKFAAAGKNFMSVGLMTYVPNQLIVGSIENVVQGNGKFNHTQTGAEVAAIYGNDVDDVLTELITNLFELVVRQLTKVGRNVDLLEKRSRRNLVHGHWLRFYKVKEL